MREIALHLLDIAENSLAAQASRIGIDVVEDLAFDRLYAAVLDNGRGMDADLLARVTDPFVTSRTTRKVGLGIPLLKAAAESCNGGLSIQSTPGQGTQVDVEFQRSHIDRMPLGDLASTCLTLLIAHPEIDWRFGYRVISPEYNPPYEFQFESRPVIEALDGVPLTEPEILTYLRGIFRHGVTDVQSQIPDSAFISP